jgi:hypothetical protein
MIETSIAGIPCLIRVDDYQVVKPWPGPASTAPSSDDYHGYVEIDYTVCDRRGRPAPWLEDKMTDLEREKIEGDIVGEIRGG